MTDGALRLSSRALRAFACASLLIVSACSAGQRGESSETPDAVADFTTIDFGKVANYANPALPPYFDETVAALDNTPPTNRVDDRIATLGRVLFYDLRLSTNNRASCASCHQRAFGFTDPMRFSNGISTAATTEAHAMRLANIRYWKPGTAFWDRRADTVEAQVSHPIHSLVELGWGGAAGGMDDLIAKLQGTAYYPELYAWAFGSPSVTEQTTQRALAQFLRAMISHSSRWDAGYAKVFAPDAPNRALDVDLPNFSPQENRGRHLFMTAASQGGAGCSACHLPPTFALAQDAHSNGLDAGETHLFKAPSLRNVGLTGPYMHDGRFATLADVVDFYDSGIVAGPALDARLRKDGAPLRLGLNSTDRAALVAFLKTLDDPGFIADERFADPFRRDFPTGPSTTGPRSAP